MKYRIRQTGPRIFIVEERRWTWWVIPGWYCAASWLRSREEAEAWIAAAKKAASK